MISRLHYQQLFALSPEEQLHIMGGAKHQIGSQDNNCTAFVTETKTLLQAAGHQVIRVIIMMLTMTMKMKMPMTIWGRPLAHILRSLAHLSWLTAALKDFSRCSFLDSETDEKQEYQISILGFLNTSLTHFHHLSHHHHHNYHHHHHNSHHHHTNFDFLS